MNRLMIGVAKISLLALLAPATFSPALGQDKSGVAAAVNPNAVSTPPGQVTRTLLIGSDVIFRERITTQVDGQVQLIFLDESSLTVGPGSDVTIDEFVYDPKGKTGKMSVRMAGGLVRFVGGRISKSGDVSITTPVSVIGIRGGMGYVEATETSSTATSLFGTLSVKGATGGEQIVSRPGFAVTTQLGQAPALPAKVDAAQLVRLSRTLEAPPQAAARNASGAIEGKLDSSQVSEKNSGQSPDSISPEASAQRADAAKNPSSSDVGLARQAVQQNVTSTTQSSVIGTAGGLSGTLFIGSTAIQTRTSDGATGPFKLFPATFTNGRIDPTSNIARFTLSDGSAVALPLPPRGTRSVTDLGVGSTISYQAPDGRYFFVNTSVQAAGVTSQVVYTGGQAVRAGNYTTSGSILRTFDFVSDTSAALKFTGSSLGTYTNKVETPYIMRTQPSGNFADNGQARTVGLYAGLGIDGQGAGQRSGVMVATGQVFQTDASVGGKPANANIVRGTFNDGVNPVLSRVNTVASTPLDGRQNAFYGSERPDYFTLTELDYPSGVPTAASSRLQSPGTTGSVNTPVQYAYAMASSTAGATNASINSDARTARTMNGYIGGIMGLASTGANALQIKTQDFDPANISLTTDPATNRLVAKFKFDTLPTAAGNFTAGGASLNPTASRNIFGEFIRFEYNFGSITGSHRARSAFINDSVYAATEQRLTQDATFGSFYGNGNQSTPNPTLRPVGQVSNDPAVANLSVADRTNASDALYLVSSAAVPITGLLPTGTPLCECNFLSWGWWGGTVGIDGPADGQRLPRLHLANYVVGVLPQIGQIPTTGSATYVGNAIGTVKNGALNYIAAGGFQKNWDFASRSGTITVSNFDGGNYTARSTSVANPGNFAYSGTGTRGVITVNGSFFSSPTDPVKGVGGQFLINQTGNAYRASGVVIGQR